jgi:hypothetical protein
MPRDQTSLNRGEYEPLRTNCPPWHSENDGSVSENWKYDRRDWHTWAHMIGAACSELFTERIGSGQSEIGDGKT